MKDKILKLFFDEELVLVREDDKSDKDGHNDMWGIELGANTSIQITEKTNINDLNGPTNVYGGDILVGLDILTDENDEYLGWQWGGTTMSYNGHRYTTKTSTIFELPTLNLPKRMKEWGWIK